MSQKSISLILSILRRVSEYYNEYINALDKNGEELEIVAKKNIR